MHGTSIMRLIDRRVREVTLQLDAIRTLVTFDPWTVTS
jgi:hypothetical protein